MFKRLAIFILLLCFCYTTAAYAVEPLVLNLEGISAANQEMRIYCNTNLETPPQKDDFSVTLGNAVLPVKGVVTLGDTDEGTSFVFLADVSGSIKSSQLGSIKDTLTAFAGMLSGNDNVSVVTVGNETYTQDFVSAPNEILSQIDAISVKGEDTNLYEGIVQALDILSTNESCHDKKCLVILSDGEEDNIKGITREEVEKKIEASHIPIFTVAMLGNNPSDSHVESAKILGSFARLSPGGKHYIHTLNQAESVTIADDIMASIRNSLILTVDLSSFTSEGGELLLQLDLTVAGSGKTRTGYTIPTAGLSEPTSFSPSPSPILSPSPSPSPSPGQDSDVIWVIAGAGALLIAGLIVFLLLRQKKKHVPAVSAAPASPAPAQAPHGSPKIALRMTKIGLVEEQVYRKEFAGELVIGRDPEKSGLSFEKDDLLSARHCSISYEKEGVILHDLGSTNGTFVNGVPIKDRYVLENDDVLLIGSMELRINWELLGG